MNNKQIKFHSARRKELMKKIGKGSAALIFSNTPRVLSYDQNYNFSQNKNFYYLTGFYEPNAALLLIPDGVGVTVNSKTKQSKTFHEILFVQVKNEKMETWNGERLGHERVMQVLGIEQGFPNSSLVEFLSCNIFGSKDKLYLNIVELYGLAGEMKNIVSPLVTDLQIYSSNTELIDINFLMGKMRRRKRAYEIECMKKAIEITRSGFINAIKFIKPGNFEYQVQAAIEYGYAHLGASGLAYPTIAASGNNACILHYEANSDRLKSGEMLLIDSGAKYMNYCADITRTFPVNGKFNKVQRFVYDIVLAANKECIKRVKPGVSMSSLKKFCHKFMAHKLFKSGVLKDEKLIKDYAVHGPGHHIGLDTHDAVPYSKKSRSDFDKLKTGDVVTIEPGLYFKENDKTIPAAFRGMGVRIEDDILVTRNGNKNLSEDIPKERDEIESLMSK